MNISVCNMIYPIRGHRNTIWSINRSFRWIYSRPVLLRWSRISMRRKYWTSVFRSIHVRTWPKEIGHRGSVPSVWPSNKKMQSGINYTNSPMNHQIECLSVIFTMLLRDTSLVSVLDRWWVAYLFERCWRTRCSRIFTASPRVRRHATDAWMYATWCNTASV